MYNEEAWVVLDYFVGIYCGMAVITRATKTRLTCTGPNERAYVGAVEVSVDETGRAAKILEDV